MASTNASWMPSVTIRRERRGAALAGLEERALDRAVDRDRRGRRRRARRAGSSPPSRAGPSRTARRTRAQPALPTACEPVKVTPRTLRVMDQCVADARAAAVHEVERPGRQAGARDDLGERPRGGGNELGRLEHDRVAVGEGRRDLPRRDRDREVPRRDDADHAERLAQHVDIDAGSHRADVLAADPQRLAGEVLEDPRGALDLARCPRPWACPPRARAASPSSSARAASSTPIFSSAVKRSAGVAADHAGAAPSAASTATSTCAASAIAYSPTTSVRSDGFTSCATPPPSTHPPPT